MNAGRPVLRYRDGRFAVFHGFTIRDQVRRAGFAWNGQYWVTSNAYAALEFAPYADQDAWAALRPLRDAIERSAARYSPLPVPAPSGLEYLPFQKAGILTASTMHRVLLADEQGLGKTIQAIGLANYLGLRRILVICPAGLRLNWLREMSEWHLPHLNPGIDVLERKTDRADPRRSAVVSYDLASYDLDAASYDLVIVDEAHYVKMPSTRRTRVVLGSRSGPGLARQARRVLALTGTPIPNRVDEIYGLIQALAPQVINSMTHTAFVARYALTQPSPFGRGYKIVGARNTDELARRLRAGFMVRRLKSEVLEDLPPKRYKLVVFPKTPGTAKVIRRELPFSADEIIRHGAPVGTALPEIRHEMGVAKVPQALQYIDDLVGNSSGQVVVFAHHRKVIELLHAHLEREGYRPLVVTGDTSLQLRDRNVRDFQTDPTHRVFIGQIQAAGTGITLSAASDVVMVEGSWVPGENAQAEDRCHRIGQHQALLVHYLVVEGSLDAAILGAAARKRADAAKILTKE